MNPTTEPGATGGAEDTRDGASPAIPIPDGFRTGTIAIVGRPNVGKSTLLNRLIGQKISITSRKAQTTRHRIHGICTTATAQFVFVDTPGFQLRHMNALNKSMNRAVTSALAGVDVVLFVVEAGRFSDADRAVLRLLPADLPVLLVVNKSDQVKDKAELLPYLGARSGERSYHAIVPVSARDGVQTDVLLAEIEKLLPEAPPMFGADEMTDRNERFLATEIVREKVFRLMGDELPYGSTVIIDKFEEEGRLRRIFATILVARDSHKGMLIGAGGAKLKQIGTDARLDMEKLFDAPVYLELWVKVKSGWADNEAQLKSCGYE